MNTTLRAQAETIVTASIHAVLPNEAVRRALQGFAPAGRVFLAAAGQGPPWQMAHAAVEVLGPAGRRRGHYQIRPLERRDSRRDLL